ncbi:hypothetical protein WJX81_007765 [Elliptochloris bilobata]|uniref:Protein kinase domain-containing protein n=1 Tax=Elliptochloris bilobata TaxID=381761 RepID=A0AAW1RY80_9CHLO
MAPLSNSGGHGCTARAQGLSFAPGHGQQLNFASASVSMQLLEYQGADGADLPLVYSPEAIDDFWGRRPVDVASRAMQLLGIGGSFFAKFAWDFFTGRLAATEVQRAIELRNIVTSLGPAFIKLGQALSIRPDLLSPAAMVELQKLCDKVPSFDSGVAMRLVDEELGRPWQEVYSELTAEPIAAASLGQVYKGRLKNGDVVAVKVQRPYVLETVTIDLFIVRKLGVFLRRYPEIRTDVVALIDEWASRFFEELDYVNEGRNATAFAESLRVDLPQVVVPRTYSEFTTRRVLTCEWIEGEKLSQSRADDVASLVNVGLICYLKQLLDTGLFHADPHPGNLIRTPDGRLAILDMGLMTRVDETISVGMLEAIAHLVHRDYDRIVQDFVTLQFIPRGTDLSPIMPVLAKVFDQALAGGGAKSINFQELAADLAQITFDFPFVIPPYFALIIRAISVLEGIALVGDPGFAIVDQSYPYVARRLLASDSPQLREALRYMIYGKEGRFNAERLIDLLDAYEDFAAAKKSARGDMDALPSARAAPPALRFVLSPEGAFFRAFLTKEIVVCVDALSRAGGGALAGALGLGGAALPIPLPGAARWWLPLAPALTLEDRQAIANVTVVAEYLTGERGRQAAGRRAGSSNALPLLASLADLAPLLAAVAPDLVRGLASRVSARLLRELYVP